MKVEELFESENLVRVDENTIVTESRAIQMMKKKASELKGQERKTRTFIFQHTDHRSKYVVFTHNHKDYFRFNFVDGQVDEPVKIDASKMRRQMGELRVEGYDEVDSRTFFQKYWQPLTGAFISGTALGLTLGPIGVLGPIVLNSALVAIGEIKSWVGAPMGGNASGAETEISTYGADGAG